MLWLLLYWRALSRFDVGFIYRNQTNSKSLCIGGFMTSQLLIIGIAVGVMLFLLSMIGGIL